MGHKKLILDLVFAAAIPLAILSWGKEYLGLAPRMTFILAGLIPASYVLIDILFISKKFNFITTVVGITAVMHGGVSFLQVSGWKYALADTAGTISTFFIYGVSLALGRPVVNYFVVQVFEVQTPDEEALLWRMLKEKEVHKWMVIATLILLLENFLRGAGLITLNYYRVTALFGTDEFNLQKRNVDAMTRFIAPVFNIGGMFAAFYFVNNAIDNWIGDAAEDGGTLFEQIKRRFAKNEGKLVPPATAPSIT